MATSCAVCISDICYTSDNILDPSVTAQDAPRAIPCGHVFCKGCISHVLKSKCPTCRAPFDKDSEIYSLCFQREVVRAPSIIYLDRYVQDLRRQYVLLENSRETLLDEIHTKAHALGVQRSRMRHYTGLLETYSEDALAALKKVDMLIEQYEKERAHLGALERLRTTLNTPLCTPLRRTRSEADVPLPPAPKRARHCY